MRAVPRAALREEARRCVGDTGLLDHLLRHMPRAGEMAQEQHLQVRDILARSLFMAHMCS